MMKRFLAAFFLLLVALPTLGAQVTAEKLAAERADVVLIRASVGDNATETAAGLYVGRDQANAYFVTAFHAVQKKGTAYPVDSVTIQFVTGPSSFSGKVLNHFNLEKDLAVVSLPLDDLPASLPKMSHKDP
jgi:hypothetical protein